MGSHQGESCFGQPKSKSKNVRISSKVKVCLIPTRDEYIEHQIADQLFWQSDDYAYFKHEAALQLKEYMLHKSPNEAHGGGVKEAMRGTSSYLHVNVNLFIIITPLYLSRSEFYQPTSAELADYLVEVLANTPSTNESNQQNAFDFNNLCSPKNSSSGPLLQLKTSVSFSNSLSYLANEAEDTSSRSVSNKAGKIEMIITEHSSITTTESALSTGSAVNEEKTNGLSSDSTITFDQNIDLQYANNFKTDVELILGKKNRCKSLNKWPSFPSSQPLSGMWPVQWDKPSVLSTSASAPDLSTGLSYC